MLKGSIIIGLCMVSAVFGLIGNFIIVAVAIYKQKQRRKMTTYKFLICQLAIADLLFAFTILFDIHSLMHTDMWIFGKFSCKFIMALQSTSTSTTIGILMVMACERYLGLRHPLQHRWSIRRTSVIIIVIWLYDCLTFVPFILALEIKEGKCIEIRNSSEHFRKAYTMFLFLTNFVVPLVCITIFHILIVTELKKHSNEINKQQPTIKRQNDFVKRRCKTKYKLVKMLLAITLSFIVLTLPNQLWYIWHEFQENYFTRPHATVLEVFANLVYLALLLKLYCLQCDG